ncbi:hypothetical protein DCS_02880 [Drechmeria coniospora]|uniref:Uncharacterized protein n=1 Tax=Drechmeria coniospora TaxID=98403 RepID=A0A151GXA5_DRECN|nr:hypothetical protein DCS_02880 [Drechmeria coniospora]KYK61737.1 hypothetical protein DCS_02880 [Drechmeria coniospora]ODA82541.1 hypothetical protein RJ55_01048 [Drechmeria coniospora]
MADVQRTGARVRRAFRYPSGDADSGSDAEPTAIDEQEQEQLIALLAAQNTARNEQFRLALLALPLMTTLPYLPLVFRPPTALLALLSLSSLLSTAYLLHRLPPTVTGIAPLDAWSRREDVRAATEDARLRLRTGGRRQARDASLALRDGGSPLDLYLPYLNLGLVLMLALLGLVTGRGADAFGWVGMGNLPVMVLAVVCVSKVVMGGVDPEKELSALKYPYKGA